VALQAHNRYLVTSCDDGLMVIDQHALHERILYEQIRQRVLAGSVEVQRLLAPLAVELSPSEAALVLDSQATLARLGVEVEAFGGSTVLVRGYPAMLGGIDPGDLLRQLALQLAQGERALQRRDVLDELLHMLACKGAVKAGDPLSSAEVDALLEYRHVVQDSHHCPHGRPTTLVFTREELDRRFKRI
jgi:DNA mismatch repair protein MutL